MSYDENTMIYDRRWVWDESYLFETVVLVTMGAIPWISFVISYCDIMVTEPAIDFDGETWTNFRINNSTGGKNARYQCNQR